MEKFKKMLEKKRQEGHGKMDPIEVGARHSVLSGLMKAMDKEGLDKVKGLKKVTVAASDAPHLMEGMDKAKEIIKEGEKEVHGGDEHDDELLKHELEESPEYDDEESEEAMDDSPENHIHAAEHNDKKHMYAKGGTVGMHEGQESPHSIQESPEHDHLSRR